MCRSGGWSTVSAFIVILLGSGRSSAEGFGSGRTTSRISVLLRLRVPARTQHVRDHVVALLAQRRQIARPFAAETFVRPVMDVDDRVVGMNVAETAPS